MANVCDYLDWRGDLSFAASPFCEVDNLVLSMLSFVDYAGIVPETPLGNPVRLSECLERNRIRYPRGEDFGQIIPDDVNTLFGKAARSTRFRDVYAVCYRSELSEAEIAQFAAVAFVLPDDSLFFSFRGTDDTLIGWQEDFTLSYDPSTRAQELAVEFLADAASVYRGPIRTGGHSKGGNLAVFAAAFAPEEVRMRVTEVYSNDGPGFMEEVLSTPEYASVRERIVKLVPQSSVIGMLLGSSESVRVIRSTRRSGLAQHDPFSWTVRGREFTHLTDLSKQGQRNREVLGEWLRAITPEERRLVSDTLFSVLASTGAKTVTDLGEDQLAKIGAALKSLGGLDKTTRETVRRFLRAFAEANFGLLK